MRKWLNKGHIFWIKILQNIEVNILSTPIVKCITCKKRLNPRVVMKRLKKLKNVNNMSSEEYKEVALRAYTCSSKCLKEAKKELEKFEERRTE